MSCSYPGYFITFEGTEGCGKTTQIQLLAEWLEENRIPFYATREPGGTIISNEIRRVVHNAEYIDSMEYWTEVFLYQASRAQHVREVLIPRLMDGEVVICDRYMDSSTVYQGIGREIGMDKIKLLNSLSTGGLNPDLTLYFDIDYETANERSVHSGKLNRMDLQPPPFYIKVLDAFDKLILEDRKEGNLRWERVNAKGSIEEVFTDLRNIVECRLIENGFIERPSGRIERIYKYD